MTLQDRTIVIIGGTSGIGRRVAQLAHAEGARLVLAGRDAARLAEVRDEFVALGGDISVYQVDAHDEASLRGFFEALPAFDHLVSMVGDVMGGGFLDAPMSAIRHVVESKFFANVSIARLAAGKLRDGGDRKSTRLNSSHFQVSRMPSSA